MLAIFCSPTALIKHYILCDCRPAQPEQALLDFCNLALIRTEKNLKNISTTVTWPWRFPLWLIGVLAPTQKAPGNPCNDFPSSLRLLPKQHGTTVASVVWRARKANCRHVDAFNVILRALPARVARKSSVSSKGGCRLYWFSRFALLLRAAGKEFHYRQKKRDLKCAPAHEICKKKSKQTVQPSWTLRCAKSTIRHFCYNMSAIDISFSINNATVWANVAISWISFLLS